MVFQDENCSKLTESGTDDLNSAPENTDKAPDLLSDILSERRAIFELETRVKRLLLEREMKRNVEQPRM